MTSAVHLIPLAVGVYATGRQRLGASMQTSLLLPAQMKSLVEGERHAQPSLRELKLIVQTNPVQVSAPLDQAEAFRTGPDPGTGSGKPE